jgi:hypothetical protein
VILLVLLAAVWVVVLAPTVWRRMKERGGVVSIDHFHHQLELLEHAGPKIVTPAYRLRSAGSEAPVGVASARPKLVLLRAVEDGQSADIEDVDGSQYARVGVIQSPQPSTNPEETETELAAHRRQQARHRCTFFLRLLVAAAITTGVIGALPNMRLAWIFTGITGIAALSLVGLVAYAREIEGHRQQRTPVASPRHQRAEPLQAEVPPEEAQFGARSYAWEETFWGDELSDDELLADEILPLGAAQAGFPGAWDEEEEWEEEPLRRASGGR